MSAPNIVALAGSTRRDSYNRRLIHLAAEAARKAGAGVTLVDLSDYPLPLYDGDLEQAHGLPERAAALGRLLARADGLLIASPEYNASVSALLKNTIDWLSRPGHDYGGAVFSGKLAALVSASPAAFGGIRGLAHLRSILTNLGVLVLPHQASIGAAHEKFDAQGRLTDPSLSERVETVAGTLVETLRRLANPVAV